MDVRTIFLNADLDETEYIWPLDGVSVERDDVNLPKKALYGLMQAPRAWYKVETDGFQIVLKTSCILRIIEFNCIASHVDDLIIT